MTNLTKIPSDENLPNKKMCQTCVDGNEFETCRPNPRKGDNEEDCKEQCQNQFNAESYYFDKNGSKRCYCGKTKAICEQYKYVDDCKDGINKACKLISYMTVNDIFSSEITSENCKEKCKDIMKSSNSIYCDDKCVCIEETNSSDKVEKYKNYDIVENFSKCYETAGQLTCSDGSLIANVDNLDGKPIDYFSIKPKLGDERSDNVKSAFCGCDKSVVSFYNNVFKDCVGEKPTLDGIWTQSVKAYSIDPSKTKDLRKTFESNLNSIINKAGGSSTYDDKLRALVTYEMCRLTNTQYTRQYDMSCPDPSSGFGGWLNCHLNPDTSSSGYWLNIGVKVLVMLMLIHLLFRTLFPSHVDIKDSLIFAMFMPQKLLYGKNREKCYLLVASLVIMLYIMVMVYSTGSSTKVWAIYGGIMALLLIATLIGFFSNNQTLIIGIIGLITSTVTFFVVATSNANNSNDSSEIKNVTSNLDITKDTTPLSVKILISLIILCICLIGLSFPLAGKFPFFEIIRSPLIYILPTLIFIVIILLLNPRGSDQGQTFIKYFIPQSISQILYSGLALSIYAICLGALMTKLVANGISSFLVAFVFFIVFVICLIIYFSTKTSDERNADIGDDTKDDPDSTSKYQLVLLCILASFIAISVVSGVIGNKEGGEYSVPYIISTVFGVLPLSMFLIIINFAIASYSPAIELLFLVIYRFSGFAYSRFPNNGIGKLILKIFGKRSTDKWVLPFLPFVSNFIELFYLISGDDKPGYFNGGGTITGVSNTEMWWS